MEKQIQTALVGVGGGACAFIARLSARPHHGYDLIAIDTAQKPLNKNPASQRLLIGESICKRLGCGGLPIMGREAALESEPILRRALRRYHMVVVGAGMSGGCGGGALPEIVRMAKDEGVERVFAVAAMPFRFEGPVRRDQARSAVVTTRLVTDHILEVSGWESRREKRDTRREYHRFDLRLAGVVCALRDLFVVPPVVELDAAAALNALGQSPAIRLGFGEAEGPNRLRKAWVRAMGSLVDGITMGKAREMQVHLVGKRGVFMAEFNEAVHLVRTVVPYGAKIQLSCGKDPSAGERLRMTVVAV